MNSQISYHQTRSPAIRDRIAWPLCALPMTTTRHQRLVQFDGLEQPGLSAFPDYGDPMLLCVWHIIIHHGLTGRVDHHPMTACPLAGPSSLLT